MVTIVGNGMGDYDFKNIDLNLAQYDTIICNTLFKENADNVLKIEFKESKEYVLENYKKENILYVVTGSPLFFSAGTIIAQALPKEQIKLINNISCKTYLLEKLFLSELQVGVISLHGRSNIDLNEFLIKPYTFILCDKNSIKRVQEALFYFKKESFTTTIGYKLGYEDEIIEEIDIFNFDDKAYDISKPYVLLIKREFELKNSISEDIEFETERGMITKKYKRHLTLQNLDLQANQLLWDIGAGSGSCGIEAFKRYKVKTTFFEKNIQRAQHIKANLANHFVVDAKLYEGEAQEFFNELEETPQRIFLGGGGEKVINQLPYLYKRLDNNGIMLINAITLKHLSQMINVLNDANIEFEAHSISLTTYKGKLDLVEPERQLFQLKVYKK